MLLLVVLGAPVFSLVCLVRDSDMAAVRMRDFLKKEAN